MVASYCSPPCSLARGHSIRAGSGVADESNGIGERAQGDAGGSTGGRAQLRDWLVVAEVALTLMLLAGAGLLLRSFYRLQQVDPGFDYQRVLTFRMSLPERKYPNPDARSGFHQSLMARLRALPGVEAASVAARLPLGTLSWSTSFLIEGPPEPPPSERPEMEGHIAGPDYFRVMGIPVLRGRAFTSRTIANTFAVRLGSSRRTRC